jgi:hypothetical protein
VVVEVETENILPKSAFLTERISRSGNAVRNSGAKKKSAYAYDLLWKTGLIGKIKIALFDVVFENL